MFIITDVLAVYVDEMKQNYKDLGFKRYIKNSLA